MQTNHDERSLSEVHETVPTQHLSLGKKILAFFGPAYLVSVGYMDPGNWATDLQGGSKFGYTLLWVLLMSNIMALLLQTLSARLGIVSRRDLAQANRETYPKWVNFCLYILAEIAIAATDLAEVLGMAIGLHLLTGMPLIWGVSITVLDTFLLLYLQKLGMRKMEAFIIALVAIIGVSFLIELWLAKPVLGEVVTGFMPRIPNEEALFIAIGIIGATVMPHNLYLHSALVQTRNIDRSEQGIRRALRFNFLDSTIALNLAFFVNAAILILAATVFHKSGQSEVAQLKDAHQLLEGMLGSSLAPTLFAIALIAAGQSSTVTGTLAGQIVMEGYLRLRINPWIRRLLTRLLAIVPAILVILWYGDDQVDALLVLSQVILSLQLGFAIIPLIHFVSDKKRMGVFVIPLWMKIAAWTIAAILVTLNLRMVLGLLMSFVEDPQASLYIKIAWLVLLTALLILLAGITIWPLKKNRISPSVESISIHTSPVDGPITAAPLFARVAVALDFSSHDAKVLSFALAQVQSGGTLILIHIVESAGAKLLGEKADDFETESDRQQLADYVKQCQSIGYQVTGRLAYRNRKQAIVEITMEEKADLLVMGAHRHSGLRDYLYGETIDAVRHALAIPILLVNESN